MSDYIIYICFYIFILFISIIDLLYIVYSIKDEEKNMIENLQEKLLKMGNFGCLCMCYLFMIDHQPEELVTNYDELIKKGIIDEDCFVRDGDAFIKYFGSNKKVLFTDVSNKQYDKYIACFQKGEKSHFVVVDKDDNILFNPYYNSISVKEGKIVGKRVLI